MLETVPLVCTIITAVCGFVLATCFVWNARALWLFPRAIASDNTHPAVADSHVRASSRLLLALRLISNFMAVSYAVAFLPANLVPAPSLACDASVKTAAVFYTLFFTAKARLVKPSNQPWSLLEKVVRWRRSAVY